MVGAWAGDHAAVRATWSIHTSCMLHQRFQHSLATRSSDWRLGRHSEISKRRCSTGGPGCLALLLASMALLFYNMTLKWCGRTNPRPARHGDRLFNSKIASGQVSCFSAESVVALD